MTTSGTASAPNQGGNQARLAARYVVLDCTCDTLVRLSANRAKCRRNGAHVAQPRHLHTVDICMTKTLTLCRGLARWPPTAGGKADDSRRAAR